MKILNAEFITGAVSPEQFPEIKFPEVAFSGRSNVGKSTLLNSIVRRKNLARTSSTPGKTREINFFSVDNKWSFADLPGFGYAAVGKAYRMKWIKEFAAGLMMSVGGMISWEMDFRWYGFLFWFLLWFVFHRLVEGRE